jgi:hypothetical protein
MSEVKKFIPPFPAKAGLPQGEDLPVQSEQVLPWGIPIFIGTKGEGENAIFLCQYKLNTTLAKSDIHHFIHSDIFYF